VSGGAVDKFHLLRYGLATVLVFVGLKMVWLDGVYDGQFPIGVSLAVIASVIAASIGGSLLFPKAPAEAAARPVAKDAGPARQR
jgi:predicted tellurium resistance membrane protein TerC